MAEKELEILKSLNSLLFSQLNKDEKLKKYHEEYLKATLSLSCENKINNFKELNNKYFNFIQKGEIDINELHPNCQYIKCYNEFAKYYHRGEDFTNKCNYYNEKILDILKNDKFDYEFKNKFVDNIIGYFKKYQLTSHDEYDRDDLFIDISNTIDEMPDLINIYKCKVIELSTIINLDVFNEDFGNYIVTILNDKNIDYETKNKFVKSISLIINGFISSNHSYSLTEFKNNIKKSINEINPIYFDIIELKKLKEKKEEIEKEFEPLKNAFKKFSENYNELSFQMDLNNINRSKIHNEIFNLRSKLLEKTCLNEDTKNIKKEIKELVLNINKLKKEYSELNEKREKEIDINNKNNKLFNEQSKINGDIVSKILNIEKKIIEHEMPDVPELLNF